MRLSPSDVIRAATVSLLAADAATLAPAANACHAHLIKNNVNPVTYLFDVADEATFTGSAAKSAGLGAQPSFTDPNTQERVIQVKEPAGGWLWINTVLVADPGETIYAVCLTDNADAVTYGTASLDQPTVIKNVGDAIDVGNLELRFPANFEG